MSEKKRECRALPRNFRPQPSDIDWTTKYEGSVRKLADAFKAGSVSIPPEGVIIYSKTKRRFFVCGSPKGGAPMNMGSTGIELPGPETHPHESPDISHASGEPLSPPVKRTNNPKTDLAPPLQDTRSHSANDKPSHGAPMHGEDSFPGALDYSAFNTDVAIAAAAPIAPNPQRPEPRCRKPTRPHRVAMLARQQFKCGNITEPEFQQITSVALKPGAKLRHRSLGTKQSNPVVRGALQKLRAGTITEKEYRHLVSSLIPGPKQQPRGRSGSGSRLWIRREGAERPVAFRAYAQRAKKMVSRRRSIPGRMRSQAVAPNHAARTEAGHGRAKSAFDRIARRPQQHDTLRSLTKEDLMKACGFDEQTAEEFLANARRNFRLSERHSSVLEDGTALTLDEFMAQVPPCSPRTSDSSQKVSIAATPMSGCTMGLALAPRSRPLEALSLTVPTTRTPPSLHKRSNTVLPNGPSALHKVKMAALRSLKRCQSLGDIPRDNKKVQSICASASRPLNRHDSSHFMNLNDFVAFVGEDSRRKPSVFEGAPPGLGFD